MKPNGLVRSLGTTGVFENCANWKREAQTEDISIGIIEKMATRGSCRRSIACTIGWILILSAAALLFVFNDLKLPTVEYSSISLTTVPEAVQPVKDITKIPVTKTLDSSSLPADPAPAEVDSVCPLTSAKDCFCNFNHFKKHISTNEFFPDRVKWVWQNNTPAYFQPNICKFKYKADLPLPYLPECLLKKNITKILMIGDSQAARYFNEFRYELHDSGFRCKLQRIEGGRPYDPDPAYYVNGTDIKLIRIISHRRDCHGCRSKFYECATLRDMVPRQTLQLEILAMDFYSDTELITYESGRLENCLPTCTFSHTTQEFFFHEYLKGNFPDVLFLFGNNHYNKHNLNLLRIHISTLASLLRNTVPKTTSVVWFTTPGEWEEYRKENWKNQTFEGGVYKPQEYISLLNKAVFENLEPWMNEKYSNFLPFLDLQSVSKDVLAELNLDGVHMVQPWYKLLMSYFTQTLCNSDLIKLLGTGQRRVLERGPVWTREDK